MSKFAQIYSEKVDFDGLVSTGKLIEMKNLLEIFYRMNETLRMCFLTESHTNSSTVLTQTIKYAPDLLRNTV